MSLILFQLDTDDFLKCNRCIKYKEVYLYFIRDFDRSGFDKTTHPYFKCVYIILAISDLDNNLAFDITTEFLPLWSIPNEQKIRFCASSFIFSTKAKNGIETLSDLLNIYPEDLSKYKKSRENTEFEKILSGKAVSSIPCKSDNHTNYQLLRKYSHAISESNLPDKLLQLINTISYPAKDDSKKFIKTVNEHLNNNDKRTPYLDALIENLNNNDSFGTTPRDFNDNYGVYIYKNIRNSIVHPVRKRESEIIDNKQIEYKDFDIDSSMQMKQVKTAVSILLEVAKKKLEAEGILNNYLSNDECYIIEDPNLDEKIKLVNTLISTIIDLKKISKEFTKSLKER